MTSIGAGPGWRPDPSGRHGNRYWDGSQWTSWVSDGPEATQDEDFDATAFDAPRESFASSSTSWSARRIPIWVWVVGSLLLIGGLSNTIGDDPGNEASTAGNREAPSYLDFDDCYSDLLDTSRCSDRFDPSDSYATFNECSDATLEDTFCASHFEAPAPTSPPTTPTTVFRPPPPQPAPSNCNPNYSGCVPNASDVDCAGGSGNGPAYTGFTEVIGTDVYDLDADGDGFGCE